MTKSMEAPEAPSRTVGLLSDSDGAYGIGINPSAWVRSFICEEHGLISEYELSNEEIDEGNEEDELALDEIVDCDEHKTCERVDERVDELMKNLYCPLVLRPDVIRASAVFPNKCHTGLHPVPQTPS
jgi:hypothetical protein